MTLNDGVARDAAQIRDELAGRADEIKRDADLTGDAKRRLIAESHASAANEMSQLRERTKSSAQDSHRTATRSLFGGGFSDGANAISLRDASDRAQSLEDTTQARDLLRRANANGDRTLARAIVLEALERARAPIFGRVWKQVVDEQTEVDPTIRDAVRAVSEPSSAGTFGDSMKYILPSVSDLTYDV